MMPERLPRIPQPADVSPGEAQVHFFLALSEYKAQGFVGLLNSDELLRKICRIESHRWPAVKKIVFDGRYCFRLVDGKWHHPEARRMIGGKN